MNLWWDSFGEFAAMGGYGLYVWGSFGATALALVGELLSLRARRRALQVHAAEPAACTAVVVHEG